MASPQPPEAPVALNPLHNARYSLRLSERITNPLPSGSQFSTVKFNHKPQDTANGRTTTIRPSSSDANPDSCSLTIEDRDSPGSTNPSTYEYAGQRRSLKNSYVVFFDKESQSATMEPLGESYAFNLKSTPWEQDASKLARDYQQARPRREQPDATTDDDGLFSDASETQSLAGSTGGASDDEEPEEGNPFDYRRFLNQAQESQSNGFASPNSQANTPLRTTAPVRSTPLAQTQRTKESQPLKAMPKPAAKQTTSQPRKRRSPVPQRPERPAVTKPKASAVAAAPKQPQSTPSIRLDRRASSRPNEPATASAPPSTHTSSRASRSPTPSSESDDEGGLQIDYGGADPPSSRGNPRRSIALAFQQGVTGDGPISLRSAADSASPNSRLHTPNLRAVGGRKEPDVIDFAADGGSDGGEEDLEMAVTDAHREDEEEEEEGGYEEDDEDVDGDVEPMNLGSPAAGHIPQQETELVEGGGEEEEAAVAAATYDDDDDGLEDDFEADLMKELEASAAEDEAAQAESEEESEEE